MRSLFFALGILCAGVFAGSCDSSSGGGTTCEVDENYDPDLSMQTFSATITNPRWLTGTEGTKYIYDSSEEHIVVEIKGTTMINNNYPVRAVQDRVYATDGVTLIEDTTDYYAQDATGNVWYFGEDTKEYENNEVVSTEGSWQTGLDGAKPGIVMFADTALPPAGIPYRQEFSPCNAEDMAVIVENIASVTVPAGQYFDCIKTREYTPLEPGVAEFKINCNEAGLVKVIDANTNEDLETLTMIIPPP